jgi:hypothetical protein
MREFYYSSSQYRGLHLYFVARDEIKQEDPISWSYSITFFCVCPISQ